MDIGNLLIIFVAGLVSSLFGTLVGGSSLITIPVLIFLGLPPHSAIGTDRLGVTGIGIAGLYQFHKKGLVDYRIGFITAIPILVGSFIGANLAFTISPAMMKKVIAVITVSLLAVVIMRPRMGLEKTERPLNNRDIAVGLIFSLIVGVYGGFYGPMAGTFVAYILIFVFHQTFLESAATLKVGSIAMTVTAALTFAYHGAIHYPFAIAMFFGSSIGSFAGAYYSERIGNVWIKRLFMGIVFVMVIKLLFP